jgi:hypothetical protein
VVKDFDVIPRSLIGIADAGADASAIAPNTAPIKAVFSLCMEQPSVVIFFHAVPLHFAG